MNDTESGPLLLVIATASPAKPEAIRGQMMPWIAAALKRLAMTGE
jgi:hypothetical protein